MATMCISYSIILEGIGNNYHEVIFVKKKASTNLSPRISFLLQKIRRRQFGIWIWTGTNCDKNLRGRSIDGPRSVKVSDGRIYTDKNHDYTICRRIHSQVSRDQLCLMTFKHGWYSFKRLLSLVDSTEQSTYRPKVRTEIGGWRPRESRPHSYFQGCLAALCEIFQQTNCCQRYSLLSCRIWPTRQI